MYERGVSTRAELREEDLQGFDHGVSIPFGVVTLDGDPDRLPVLLLDEGHFDFVLVIEAGFEPAQI